MNHPTHRFIGGCFSIGGEGGGTVGAGNGDTMLVLLTFDKLLQIIR